MNDDNFNNSIMHRIHSDNLLPKPRWYFVSEQWFFIALIAIATVVGSIAVTSSLFILTDHDWFAIDHLEEGALIHIVKTVPYLWIGIVAMVIGVTYYNAKKIGRGYRYAPWRIIGISLLVSIITGGVLFLAGTGSYLDHYFDRHFPPYRALVSSNNRIWIYPEDGLLSGKIISVTGNSFALVDMDKQPWTVSVSAIDPSVVMPGAYVKMLGTMTDGSSFAADTVLPWRNERKSQ